MDTAKKYRNDEFYVAVAGELPPDWYVEHMESQESTVSVNPTSSEHFGVPVDGWVTFYDPDLYDNGEPFKHGTFPFRSVTKDGAAWAGNPDNPAGERFPIWKWENPGADPHDALTLSPSIGLGDDFHCYVRAGEINWL